MMLEFHCANENNRQNLTHFTPLQHLPGMFITEGQTLGQPETLESTRHIKSNKCLKLPL